MKQEVWHPSRWTWKTYAGAGLFLALLNFMGPNGLLRWILLTKETQRLATQAEGLREETRRLRLEISSFESSDVAKERAIREGLGYLKADEFSVEISP
jgi:cell division protein FtsB